MNGRSWQYADLNAIAALEAENFSDPWNHRMLADSFLSGNFYGSLLEEDGAITAYGGVSVVLDEAEVQLICTAEVYRRCGRGGKILEDLLQIAEEKGAKRVFLEVRVSNAPAMSMYLKYGFCGLYARSRYYADGEDALVMVKELG
ncbi:MAG TPA: ribosomal protein S18-alanine N-acetyltransferase [Candidatus Gallimonas intestinigallinarum]|uniref:[Ribosomal protein bS18]-alanine N-acetyltransferase n=1 Tax=Candidatus Gallimonas intestinigallinarum TaxID=2838604 RepID=A0A9D2DVI9_9FIRM|nr:ribosomal protein S18-alanine N-acetyltransferase [Candidatus Gallimonas intestinigallinarum]